MKSSTFSSLKFLAVAATASIALTACMTQSEVTDYRPDGGNVIISQEASNMGQVLNTPATLAKGSNRPDTGERILHPLDTATCLDSSGQGHRCFVRDAKFTSSDTQFVRERLDTIWLLDSNKAYMTEFHPFLATTIIHHRHVTKISGDKNLDIQFNTTLARGVDSSGNKVLVWNGTINGTLNGAVVSATIVNVTRPVGALCGDPEDGFIHLKRNGTEITIDFEKDGKAMVSAKDRKGRSHHWQIDGGKETEND